MKLIYLANIRIPTEKAHGYQIMKMCEQFADKGVNVQLVVTKRKNNLREDPFEYYNIKKNFNIKYLPVWDVLFLGKFGYLLEIFSFSKNIKKEIDLDNAVVYTRDIILIRLLPSIKNLVLELHALPKKNKKIKKIFYKTKKIICITNCLKEKIINLGYKEDTILVAPSGVDLERYDSIINDKEMLRNELGLPKDKKIIAYIGRATTMGKSKGVEELLENFVGLSKKSDIFFLLIVGLNIHEKEKFRNFFRLKGIDEHKYLLMDYVDKNSVIKYGKSADILIMTYPNEIHYSCYMSPLKLFEYMATKNLIITTDLPSIREVLNDKNAIFIKSDYSNFEDILLNAIENSYVDLTIQAYKDVQNYTWDKRAKKILEFIN